MGRTLLLLLSILCLLGGNWLMDDFESDILGVLGAVLMLLAILLFVLAILTFF